MSPSSSQEGGLAGPNIEVLDPSGRNRPIETPPGMKDEAGLSLS